MDTYRLSVEDWSKIVNNQNLPSQSDVINEIKNTSGALQDPLYDDAVEWMDAYFCYLDVDGYECSAFQPAYEKGTSPGYPRFGIEESEAGRLFYSKLDWTSDPHVEKEWVIEGAAILATGFAAVAMLFTF